MTAPRSHVKFRVQFCAVTRTYQKRKRAEREAETRRRIVEATVALHTSLGPARTTISAIAEKAGVQRHTVYAHFPDEGSLFSACTNHWAALHPFPRAEAWATIDDPLERLAAALRDVWAWYEGVEHDLELFLRDAALVPAGDADMTRYAAQLSALADRLAAGLGRSSAVRAAVGHALAFETWRSLVRREGLSRSRAVRLMLTLVERAREPLEAVRSTI
jgi:AcrR family transcriptional regulator